ncbi:MAG: manganese efflux pump [Bacteroidales bacterium]|nr:manganese efflux pump [Bacteroidales bacterium]
METLVIFILALGLAMDCFAIAISNSDLSGTVKAGVPLKLAIAFAFAHLVLLFAGYHLGSSLQSLFLGAERFVALFVFLFIGSKMIMDARKRKPQSKVFDINATRVIVVLSIASGIDAFLAGIALGINGLKIYLAGLLVALTVFVFTLGGMAGGRHFGMPFSKTIAIIGGLLLIMGGISFMF